MRMVQSVEAELLDASEDVVQQEPVLCFGRILKAMVALEDSLEDSYKSEHAHTTS